MKIISRIFKNEKLARKMEVINPKYGYHIYNIRVKNIKEYPPSLQKEIEKTKLLFKKIKKDKC